MQRITTLLKWLNVLLIIFTLLSYLAPFINPEIFWPFAFLGVGYPWFLLANILFVFIWVILRQKYFLFSLGFLILGWVHLQSFIGLNLRKEKPTEAAVGVMSYNINRLLHIQLKDPKKRQIKTQAFINFINNEAQPDILCTQETITDNIGFLSQNLRFKYHHHLPQKGTAIFSVYPFLDSGEVDLDTKANACVWADIDVKGEIYRVYSLHLLSNKVSVDVDDVMNKGKLKERKTWQQIKGMLLKFAVASQIRVTQVNRVFRHMAESPYPVIMCGDLNEIPQSYTYKIITKNLQDAFREKALGFGTTYAGRIPALRIDYILVDRKLKLFDHHIYQNDYSDHYPVLSHIAY